MLYRLGPLVLFFVAILCYIAGHSVEGAGLWAYPATYLSAFAAMILVGMSVAVETRRTIQIFLLAGIWALGLYLMLLGDMPNSAIYFTAALCTGSTVAFFHGAMDRTRQRLYYGALTALIALPTIVAAVNEEVFNNIFGAESSRPMSVTALTAGAFYLTAWFSWSRKDARPKPGR